MVSFVKGKDLRMHRSFKYELIRYKTLCEVYQLFRQSVKMWSFVLMRFTNLKTDKWIFKKFYFGKFYRNLPILQISLKFGQQ